MSVRTSSDRCLDRTETAKPAGRIDTRSRSAQLPRETEKCSRYFYIFRKYNIGGQVFLRTQYIDVDC